MRPPPRQRGDVRPLPPAPTSALTEVRAAQPEAADIVSDPITVHRTVAGQGFVVREVEYPPGYRQAAHAHAELGVTLVVRGSIRERVGGREELATALSVVVKPAGVVHADDVGERGARTIQLLFDRGASGALRGPGIDPGPWRWVHAGPEARQMLSLLRASRRTHRADRLRERVARLLQRVARRPPEPWSEAPGWLVRARELLDEAAEEGARVGDVAAELGVHPGSLTRAFRRHYGASASAYRVRQRLRQAVQLLQDTTWKVSRVAHEAGYADHPHLCRSLRQATGMTPSEIRSLGQAPHV